MDYNILAGSCLVLVLRLRGGGFPPIILDIFYNNEFKENVKIDDFYEKQKKIEEFIMDKLKKYKIGESINELDFYCGENKINDKMNEPLMHIFQGKKTLNIFSKMKSNLPKEDNIILSQEMNGLWTMDISKLGWFNFTKEKWNEFLNRFTFSSSISGHFFIRPLIAFLIINLYLIFPEPISII